VPVVNVDHVYENTLLVQFFDYIFTLPDAPTCEEFNRVFIDTDYLQTLFEVNCTTPRRLVPQY
jgi:hypothetical protein